MCQVLSIPILMHCNPWQIFFTQEFWFWLSFLAWYQLITSNRIRHSWAAGRSWTNVGQHALGQEIYYKPNQWHQRISEEACVHCSEAKGWWRGGGRGLAHKEDWGGYWNNFFVRIKNHLNVWTGGRELEGLGECPEWRQNQCSWDGVMWVYQGP